MEGKVLLEKGLKELNIEADDEQVRKLEMFKDLMLDWNEKINLTAITDSDEVYIKHFLDSATCLSTGYIKDSDSIIDVGTGAGFPGVPIKILRESIDITLLDSLNKRIKYLEDVVAKVNLKSVTLLHSRAEDAGLSKQHREKYDVALARAVASMNVLCEYCLPFVKAGGYFICQKGPSYKEELEAANKAIEILGGRLKEVKPYKLPYSDITHYIIIIEKMKATPTKYPRKAGKPSSDPIV
ncbi:MAG: methyltransferase GidB [Clostridia bacterium]|jgi:16S rRNA (guanine527-N7)-methyltransferase|nr:methyltransferase GidB [Clostridia bacterium]